MGTVVEWTKGVGSKHVECPKAKDSASATIKVVLDWRGLGKPGIDSEVGKTVRVPARQPHAGEAVVVVSQQRRYQSNEDNEDMGDCMGGGWYVTLGCRPATPEEEAKLAAEEESDRAAAQAAAEKVAADKAAKEAELSAAKAKLAALTAGMLSTESYDQSVLRAEDETVLRWKDGNETTYVVRCTAVTGEAVYLAYSHYFDDDRVTLYAPRPVVEAGWTALAARYQETPEKARDYLTKYRGCVGTDWREWLVANATPEGRAA